MQCAACDFAYIKI